MKKKDLFRSIKESALNEMPDVISRIDISKVHIDEPESVKSSFNFRKAFSYTFASLFVFFSGIMIYNFGVVPNITDSVPLESTVELVGFQTVSGTTLIESFETTELSFNTSSYDLIPLANTEETIDDQLDLINRYMNLAETVLGSQDGYIYEEVESTMAEYAYAFIYKGSDLVGNLIQYKGYYNISETQQGTFYNGIIKHDEETFEFENHTVQNGERTYMYYKISLDDDNYVEVKNMSDSKMQKFQYSIYTNGNLSDQSELTLVRKRNTLRAEIAIQKQDGELLRLQIERDITNPNNQRFKINYRLENNNEEGEIVVGLKMNQSTNKYQYEYTTPHNPSVIKDRVVVTNGKANSDDFTPGQNNGQGDTPTTSSTSMTTQNPQTTGPGSSHQTTQDEMTTGPGNQDNTSGTSNNDTTTSNGNQGTTSGPHNGNNKRQAPDSDLQVNVVETYSI